MHKHFKILFLVLHIYLIPSLFAMEEYLKNYFPLSHECSVAIKQEPSTQLHTQGKTVVVPELALPLCVALQQLRSSRPARRRKPTTLQYYADFVCAEVSNEETSIKSEEASLEDEDDDEISSASEQPKKKARIVLKKEIAEKEYDADKPFACLLCPSKYGKKFYLTRHLNTTHSDERPFPCNKCKQSFKQKHQLEEHKLYHGKPTLGCPKCKSPFYRQSDLNKHLRTVDHIQP